MNINDLHQLPESHPVSQRERISLAHIDVADGLRRNRENFAKSQAKSRAVSELAASAFEIGQTVAMKNNRNNAGPIVSIDGTNISVEINGSVRTFAPTFLVAA